MREAIFFAEIFLLYPISPSLIRISVHLGESGGDLPHLGRVVLAVAEDRQRSGAQWTGYVCLLFPRLTFTAGDVDGVNSPYRSA